MNFPKVSIITVCYNSERTIEETIQSVLDQDYPNIEYIIIDGASEDRTVQIIQQYQSEITRFLSEPDHGIYDAMNKGIKLATGEIIGLINSDDTYVSKNSVTELITKMIDNETDSVFADLVIVNPKNTNQIIRYYDSSYFKPSRFRFGWMPAHPTFFVKKSIYDLVGLYSIDYEIAADYELLIRMLWNQKISYAYLPKAVIKMKSGGASTAGLSRNWILNKEIVRACRDNGIYTNMALLALKIPRKLLSRKIDQNRMII